MCHVSCRDAGGDLDASSGRGCTTRGNRPWSHRPQSPILTAVVMQVATLMPAVAEDALPAATALALETLERSLSTSNRCPQNLNSVIF